MTGAGRGIGYALAAAHLARGGHVIATCRATSEGLDALQDRHGEQIEVLSFDLRDAAAIDAASEQVTGAVDVVLNNAGIYGARSSDWRGLDGTDMLAAYDVNVLGTLRVTDAFLPHLSRSERPRVVALSSLMGAMSKRGTGSLAYRLSKAALNRAMLVLGEDLAPRGVAVACLRPGHVRTGMTGPSAPMTPQESAARMLPVVDGLVSAGRAVFLDNTGAPLDW